MKVRLIIREPSSNFNSIEKVFDTLLPFLNKEKIVLPFPSHGFWNKVLNYFFLMKMRRSIIHLSGHEHYLFALPIYKKSILTIHDVEGVYSMRGWKRKIYKKFWYDYPIKNANMITTISEFSKSELEKLGVKKTIKVIYNPLTLPLQYQPKEFNKIRPRILHIGTKQNKNLSRLLDALKGLSCELIIVGQVGDELLQKLASNKITYCIKNKLSNNEMVEEYHLADILAFVSTYEGFGLPIIEAQAIGRVVLTSNRASMPEVSGGGALLVNPFSVEEIRSGITNLIKNSEQRESLIKKGLENVNRFNKEKIAKQYIEVYNELLSSH